MEDAEANSYSGKKVLLVDDEVLALDACEALFAPHGILVDKAQNQEQAFALLRENPTLYPVVILDFYLGNTRGADVANRIRDLAPGSRIFIFSGLPSVDTVRNSFRSGAVDFFRKGHETNTLLRTVKDLFEKLESTDIEAEGTLGEESSLGRYGIVSRSKKMFLLEKKIRNYSKNPYTVLVIGETGTGKELVARAIATENKSAFYPVNCARFRNSDHLMESELFGHEKGAFTGADKTKVGLFETARGGVVFLDEIHEMSLNAQVKLLRVLQEKKIQRVGGTREVSVSVKIVAASKPQIVDYRDQGRFLIDLYNRLNVFQIKIPALSERAEDVEPIARLYCKRYAQEAGKTRELSPEVLRAMETYSWPGNVRELQNMVLRLVVDSVDKVILLEDLKNAGFSAPIFASHGNESETHSGATIEFDLKSHLLCEERAHIFSALKRFNFQQVDAARSLGLPESTLRAKIKKLGIASARDRKSVRQGTGQRF